jgi:hypothetical protein
MVTLEVMPEGVRVSYEVISGIVGPSEADSLAPKGFMHCCARVNQ